MMKGSLRRGCLFVWLQIDSPVFERTMGILGGIANKISKRDEKRDRYRIFTVNSDILVADRWYYQSIVHI